MRGLKKVARRLPYVGRLYRQRDRMRERRATALAERRTALDERDAALAAAQGMAGERDEARAAAGHAEAEAERAAAGAREEIARVQARMRAAAHGICRSHSEHAELCAWLRDIAPWTAEGVAKLRVGADRDGGYVMAGDLDGIVGAVSAGIGGDVSWDLAIAGRGIPVVQLDHTVEGPPQGHPLFAFCRRRLVPDGEDGPDTATLHGILAAPPFDRGGDALLKMDIEHDEWAVLDAAAPADLVRFRQIVLEFHSTERFGEPDWRARARRVTAKLAAAHRAIHIHGNNAAPFVVVAGVPLPRVFEVSWLRADDRRFSPGDHTCPGPLDRPNVPDRPDLTFVLPPA